MTRKLAVLNFVSVRAFGEYCRPFTQQVTVESCLLMVVLWTSGVGQRQRILARRRERTAKIAACREGALVGGRVRILNWIGTQ